MEGPRGIPSEGGGGRGGSPPRVEGVEGDPLRGWRGSRGIPSDGGEGRGDQGGGESVEGQPPRAGRGERTISGGISGGDSKNMRNIIDNLIKVL